MTRLSVIIPVLNEADNLESLLTRGALAAADVEIIVVDGGSDDGSAEAALRHGARVLTSESGRAEQMNRGAEAASGEFLLFLHCDSRLPEDFGKLIINALTFGSCWGRFDVQLSGGHWMFRIIGRMMNARSRLTGIATGDQGIFLQRKVFEALEGFAELPLMEDIELSRRLLKMARPYCIAEKLVTSSRRWEQRGILRTLVLMWRLRLMYFLGTPVDRLAQQYR